MRHEFEDSLLGKGDDPDDLDEIEQDDEETLPQQDLVEDGLLGNVKAQTEDLLNLRNVMPDSVGTGEQSGEQAADDILRGFAPRVGKSDDDEVSLDDMLDKLDGKKFDGPEATIVANIKSLVSQVRREKLTDEEAQVVNDIEDLVAQLESGNAEAEAKQPILEKACKPLIELMQVSKDQTKALKRLCRLSGATVPSVDGVELDEVDRKAISLAKTIQRHTNLPTLAKGITLACKQQHRNADVIQSLVGSLYKAGPRIGPEVVKQVDDLLAGGAEKLRSPAAQRHVLSNYLARSLFGN